MTHEIRPEFDLDLPEIKQEFAKAPNVTRMTLEQRDHARAQLQAASDVLHNMVDDRCRAVLRSLAEQEELFLRANGAVPGMHQRVHYPETHEQVGDVVYFSRTVLMVPIGHPIPSPLPEPEGKRLYPWTTLRWSMRVLPRFVGDSGGKVSQW